MSDNKEHQQHEKSVYNVRIRNLIGIFGMLLLFNVITFSPYIIASIIGLIVGLDKIPSQIYSSVLILFLLNNVTNSIIQSYFRRDLRVTITKFSKKLRRFIGRRKSGKRRKSRVTESTDHDKQSQGFNSNSRNGLDHRSHTNQGCDSKEGFSEIIEVSATSSVEPNATLTKHFMKNEERVTVNEHSLDS